MSADSFGVDNGLKYIEMHCATCSEPVQRNFQTKDGKPPKRRVSCYYCKKERRILAARKQKKKYLKTTILDK